MAKCKLVILMSANKKDSLKLRSDISYNIRKYRKEKQYTQEELAEFADISYDFMRRIESSQGKCGFSVFTLYKISLALNVSVDDLMGKEVDNIIN